MLYLTQLFSKGLKFPKMAYFGQNVKPLNLGGKRGWSLFTHWRTMVCWKTGDVWMNGDCRFNLLIMIEKGHRRVFFRFWPWLWNTEGSIYIMMWKKSLQFQVLYISQFTTLLSQLNNNHNPMQLGWDYHRHSPTITVSLVTKNTQCLLFVDEVGWYLPHYWFPHGCWSQMDRQ